jgi:DNA-binding transcriptional ArsR family regulator
MHALDALANPVRRDILLALRQESLSVGDIARRFPVTRPAISRHLRTLEEAGLVEATQAGTRNLYTICPEGIASAREYLATLWDDALANLQAVAE